MTLLDWLTLLAWEFLGSVLVGVWIGRVRDSRLAARLLAQHTIANTKPPTVTELNRPTLDRGRMTTYRTGRSWEVTIIRQGVGEPDDNGRRFGDELVAVVTNGDTALAERICALLNADAQRQADLDALVAPRPIADTPAVIRKRVRE